MLIHSIKLTNLLSFGPDAETIELRPLNLIIGPNGSGKSNLLEAISLLESAPDQLTKPIGEGGGISAWLWKGSGDTPIASIDTVIDIPDLERKIQYSLSFTAIQQRFEMVDEKITSGDIQKPDSFTHYKFNRGKPILNVKGENQEVKLESFNVVSSILSQRRDPVLYPEITYTAHKFSAIKLYREWSLGRYMTTLVPQKIEGVHDFLETDGSNLGVILNKLRLLPDSKQMIRKFLKLFSDHIDDFEIKIDGSIVQVFLQESGRYTIPAVRLSDGTLRFLCLLAILCNPNPPPLVCIEEPELGLHPDILPALSTLLKEASQRCQLIVTTHSDVLVDAMTNEPDSVLVCEKDENGTSMRRLDAEKLKPWLEKYRLGELWMCGEIGGTRW